MQVGLARRVSGAGPGYKNPEGSVHDERNRQMPDRREVQTALSRLLLENVRSDPHPSVAQMDMLERTMPPELVREYINVLLEKILSDRRPSIPMLRRVERLAETR